MTAPVLTAVPQIPAPRRSPETAPAVPEIRSTPAVAHQRVLHQAVRREFRLLAGLAGRAPADDVARTAQLTRHADLVARVLLQHHATERTLLWPALFAGLPPDVADAARDDVAGWTSRAAALDHSLRDLSTLARQWAVAPTEPARRAFARGLTRVADAVGAHTAAEEAALLPLLSRHLPAEGWAAVSRAARTGLSGRERMLVLGLALEDACPVDRARLLAGLSPAARAVWRVVGRRTFRATVVRLRGAPPAA